MLPKKNRINLRTQKQKGSFKAIISTEDLTVRYRQSPIIKGAVVVSKAVAKKAVDRNRARRIILEALRERNLKGEFIFIVKKNIKDYKKQNINDVLEKISRRVHG